MVDDFLPPVPPMDFRGAAIPLDLGAVAEVARTMLPGVPEASLRAVIEVETAGSGFKFGRPDALFERHIFWARLGPGPRRDRAAAAGLAYPRWGERPYPKASAGVYAEIIAAAKIDEVAALESTSWGLGQVMGSEYDEAGFPDAKSMVLAFMESERAQLVGMVRLIRRRHLDEAMAKFPALPSAQTFARAYNGSGYARNRYDEKLQAAFRLWSARLAAGPWLAPAAGDADVRSVQISLARLDLYHGGVDGFFGPITQAAIAQFERQAGLPSDGQIDDAMRLALAAAVDRLAAPPAPAGKPSPSSASPAGPPPAGGGVKTTAAGGVGGFAGGGFLAAAFHLPGPPLAWGIGLAILAVAAVEWFKLQQRSSKP